MAERKTESVMMKKKLLIIEDDMDLAKITSDMLKSYGYEVETVRDCEGAFAILTDTQFHLILMDINLPDGTGFEVCRELRKVSKIPVIFASARTSEDDKVQGLDMGGDDYLAKPYSLRELLARVNALVRRTYGAAEEGKVWQFGEVVVDAGNRTVNKCGAEIKLALKEFDLLAYLCAHGNQIIRKEELLREVWGAFSEVEISTVAVHIRWLREKLEEDPANPRFIKTVWGVGYQIDKVKEV
ncbi:response regulator transcription factor [Lachnospiraceae bacterium 64-25]